MTRAPGEGEKQRNATPLWLHFEKEIQRELGFAQILEIGKSTEIYTSHQQRTSGKLCKMADFEAQRPSQVIRSMCIFDLMVWWPQHHFTENGPRLRSNVYQIYRPFFSFFSEGGRKLWSHGEKGGSSIFRSKKIGTWPPLSYSSGSWEQHPASLPSDWLRISGGLSKRTRTDFNFSWPLPLKKLNALEYPSASTWIGKSSKPTRGTGQAPRKARHL